MCVNGERICGMGDNGILTCLVDDACQPRETGECLYFGEPCDFFEADNPSAPWR